MLTPTFTAFLLIFALDAKAQPAEPRVIGVPSSDTAMNVAMAKARQTLDDFLAVWRAKPAGASQFRLKVEIREGSKVEMFWILPFRAAGTGFEGRISNEPQVVSHVKKGQEISFSRSSVVDWGYAKDGKQVGSFTTCALMHRLPKNESDHYRHALGFECADR